MAPTEIMQWFVGAVVCGLVLMVAAVVFGRWLDRNEDKRRDAADEPERKEQDEED